MKKPYCSACKTTDGPLMKCSTNRRGSTYHRCRPCNTMILARYRKTAKGKRNVHNAVYNSIARHPERQAARVILNAAIRRGEVKRPSRCSRCRLEKKVEGHHADYSKPLKVKWVCRPCHADIERKQ